MTTAAELSCPHCGGTIKVAARLCKHCKRAVGVAAVEPMPFAPALLLNDRKSAAGRGGLARLRFLEAVRQVSGRKRLLLAVGAAAALLVIVTTVAIATGRTKWIHKSKRSEMTDEVAHTIVREAENEFKTRGGSYRPGFGLRVEDGRVGLFLWTIVEPEERVRGRTWYQPITLRFDDEEALSVDAIVDGDKRRIQIPNAMAMAAQMLRHRRLKVQYQTMFSDNGQKAKIASWTLEGLKDALTSMCTEEELCTKKASPQLYKLLADEGIEFAGGAL